MVSISRVRIINFGVEVYEISFIRTDFRLPGVQ